MKNNKFLLLIVLIVIVVFAMLNWPVFITPTDLSLGVVTVRMPLGLVMLAVLAFVSLLFLMYVVYLQASALLETRRQTSELRTNRDLANVAEASRYTELRSYLEEELAKQARQHEDHNTQLLARIDQLDSELRTLVEQTGNSLAASLGELDDRLGRSRASPLDS